VFRRKVQSQLRNSAQEKVEELYLLIPRCLLSALLTLEIKTVIFSETPANSYHATCRDIPEHSIPLKKSGETHKIRYAVERNVVETP
jgi:hypothetical protein